MNKAVSDIPKAGALAQLNRRGQIDPNMLTPKSTYTAHIVDGYLERFNIHKNVTRSILYKTRYSKILLQ